MQAIIFDFDGLILDTEVPDFQSWQETYQVYGSTLTLSTWLPYIGTGSSSSPFNIYDHLDEQIGRTLNREEVRPQRRRRYAELIAAQPILPGVEAVIKEARQLGLQLAVASSSSREWVVGHLMQRNLASYFDCIVCGDEVIRTKPHPDVYLAALAQLGVPAEQAIALEDSPNGVRAAKQAGIFCIAVPNPLTSHLSFEHADLRLNSLEELSLEKLR